MYLDGGAFITDKSSPLDAEIKSLLRECSYEFSNADSLEVFTSTSSGLYGATCRYAKNASVPLVTSYHANTDRRAEANYLLHTKHDAYVAGMVSSQNSSGSTDRKLEYDGHQLIATELPSFLLAVGHGYQADVLAQTWERLLHFGAGRLLLFRSADKFGRWLHDGAPLSGPGMTFRDLIRKYCDLQP